MRKFYTSAAFHEKRPRGKNKKKRERREKYNHRRELKKTIDRYKKMMGCQLCGYNRCSSALDFHHIVPTEKTLEIGTMLFRGFSIERIKKEIKKCKVVCKNCHVEIHEGIKKITEEDNELINSMSA